MVAKWEINLTKWLFALLTRKRNPFDECINRADRLSGSWDIQHYLLEALIPSASIDLHLFYLGDNMDQICDWIMWSSDVTGLVGLLQQPVRLHYFLSFQRIINVDFVNVFAVVGLRNSLIYIIIL